MDIQGLRENRSRNRSPTAGFLRDFSPREPKVPGICSSCLEGTGGGKGDLLRHPQHSYHETKDTICIGDKKADEDLRHRGGFR